MRPSRANAEPWGEALHRLEDREGPVVQVVQVVQVAQEGPLTRQGAPTEKSPSTRTRRPRATTARTGARPLMEEEPREE